MAQNIQIAGAQFSSVPSILIPKVGGGNAVFADPSGTTAIASDVASGKKFLLADGSEATGTASGGGGTAEEEHGTFTVSEDTVCSTKTILFSNAHTSLPAMWVICDADLTDFRQSQYSLYIAWGVIIKDDYAHKSSTSQSYYCSGYAYYLSQGSSSSQVSSSTLTMRYKESSSISSLSSSNKRYHPRYYATETGLILAASTTLYFRANRTYKWQAIW